MTQAILQFGREFGIVALFICGIVGVLCWYIWTRDKRISDENSKREARMASRLDQVQDRMVDLTTNVISEHSDAMRRLTHAIVELRQHCHEVNRLP